MVDLFLLGAIGATVVGGWRSGFIRRLAGLVFLAVSFVLGAYLREPAGAFINGIFPLIPPQYADMVGYSVVFSALLIAFNLFSRRSSPGSPYAACRVRPTRSWVPSSVAPSRSSSSRWAS